MVFSAERVFALRRLSLWMALLSLATLVLSAYIRLRAAGLGCADWPACYGQGLLSDVAPALDLVRIAHRAVATLTLLIGIRLTWCCWRPLPVRPLAGLSAGVLGVMLLLTVVGIFSADPHRVWASFINMLGGVALVALSWRLFIETTRLAAMVSGATEESPTGLPTAALLHRLVRAGRVVLIATIALGALIGARYAAVTCSTVPSCGGLWWPLPEVLAVLNPLTTVTGPMLTGDPAGMSLHLLHRGVAVVTLLPLGAAGLMALRYDAARSTAVVLLILLCVELMLGSLTVVSGFSLWLAVAHSVCAALLLAVVTHVQFHLATKASAVSPAPTL